VDLDQIAGDIIDVDLWRVDFAEEVTKESTLQWHKQDEGIGVLEGDRLHRSTGHARS